VKACPYKGDHYYYRKELLGLVKGKIYTHTKSGRYFFLKRFVDSLDQKDHFVEFYEIEFDSSEVSDIEIGAIQPIRKNKKRIYMENIGFFKEEFTRLQPQSSTEFELRPSIHLQLCPT
jgi:hypothetical protein